MKKAWPYPALKKKDVSLRPVLFPHPHTRRPAKTRLPRGLNLG